MLILRERETLRTGGHLGDAAWVMAEAPRSQPGVGRAALLHLPLLLVVAGAAAYEAAVLFATGPGIPYRLPTPFAIPIFDTPFALVAIGVGYLCL